MKKLTLFLFGSVLLLSSCNKEEATQFEVDYNTEVVVEASSQIESFDLTSPEVTTNSQEKFETNNTNADNIEEVTLKDLDLTVTSPSDQNFDFLESVEVYINAPGKSELRIAYKNSIPEGMSELSLQTVDADLAEYVKSSSFTLRFKAETDEVFAEDVHIKAYSNFQVDAIIAD